MNLKMNTLNKKMKKRKELGDYMNVINVYINFEKGICEKKGISVVTGDFNSTKLVFEFDKEYEGIKTFELKHKDSDEVIYVNEIENNEIVLVGVNDNDGVEEMFSLFDKVGDYVFEVTLYQDDGKLTSATGYITAREEQVIVGDELVEGYLPIFDTLISNINDKLIEINEKLNEIDSALRSVSNLNISAEKEGDTTTITITDQEGTQTTTEILDGEKGDTGDTGTSITNVEVNNGDLIITLDN